jgi:hypothetical protein
MARVIFEGATLLITEKHGDTITTSNGDRGVLSFFKYHKEDGHADPSVGDVLIFDGRPDPRMELDAGVSILVRWHRGCACGAMSLHCMSPGPEPPRQKEDSPC